MCYCWSVAKSCLTLFDPMDSLVNRIFQERILEWVAVSGIEPAFPAFPVLQADSEPLGKPQWAA